MSLAVANNSPASCFFIPNSEIHCGCVPSRKPSNCRDRTGCCNLRTAFASICRTRSESLARFLYHRNAGTFYNGMPRIEMNAGFLNFEFKV